MKLAQKAASRAWLAALLILAVQVLLSSCDATAILFVDQVKWDQLHVLSAVPMQKVTGEDGKPSYERLCRSSTEEPDGLQFNVLFQGTTKKGDSAEKDISIKPLDLVDNQTIDPALVTPALFEFGVDCLESYPDDDLYACANQFTGGGDLPIDDVSFFNYYQPGSTNQAKVAVAVILDMSGSMNGLATSFPPYNEDSLDKVSSAVVDPQANATDPKNSRYAALESFIKTLNKDDALIIFHYNENLFDIACEISGKPEASFDQKLADCFSTDRSFFLVDQDGNEKNALDELKGDERGRTPLWYAVESVYNVMKTHKVATKYDLRHILVLGDGPDTCGPSTDVSQCTGQCLSYNTSYEQVRSLIQADLVEDRIPIHFVQMAAKGYPDRDPRQQEIACETGGHYAFVNALDIPDGRLQDVLSKVVNRIRYTFRGYWRFEIMLSTVKKSNDPDVGWLYGLQGSGKVLRGKEGMLVNQEDGFAFKVDDAEVSGTDNADGRVSFRKECDPADKDICPDSEPYNECSSLEYWCDEQTLTCKAAQAWKPNGEKSTCKPEEVYISLETRTKTGSTTQVGNELYKIGSVETRCCRGDCMPPNPPEVPDDVAKPGGMTSACFWYDDNKGWTLQNPAKFDRDVVDCVDSGDCGDEAACLANVCSRTCLFESDCDAGQKCSQSSCVNACSGKVDCPKGWDCNAEGLCRPQACTTDADCDSGYVCADELCEYDFENPDAYRWIYFGTLNVKEGCAVEDFEPYLSKYSNGGFNEGDWSHCTSQVNCFQPPGFETEAPEETPEENPEEGTGE